jgi:hypothetical protein
MPRQVLNYSRNSIEFCGVRLRAAFFYIVFLLEEGCMRLLEGPIVGTQINDRGLRRYLRRRHWPAPIRHATIFEARM